MISNELQLVSNHIVRESIPLNTKLSQGVTLLYQKSTAFRDLITAEGLTEINESFIALTLGFQNFNIAISGGNVIDMQQKAFSAFSLISDVFVSFQKVEEKLGACQIRIGADEYSALMKSAGEQLMGLEMTITGLLFTPKQV